MSEYTKGPWKVQLDSDPGFSGSTHIVTAEGDRIAKLTCYVLASRDPEALAEHAKINTPEVRDANAARIVLCVNTHDDLVEALKAMLDEPDRDKARLLACEALSRATQGA